MKTRIRNYFASVRFNRPALIESGKLFFAIVGVGCVLANLSVCRLWQVALAVPLIAATWFAIYLQMEGVQ